MKFVECNQGEAAWYAARAGRATASMFASACKMVGGLNDQQKAFVAAVMAGQSEKDAAASAGYKAVPKSALIVRALAGEQTEEPSDEAKRYAADIAIERISGMPHGEPIKTWVMERGHEMEARARIEYEARTGSLVTEAGICITDGGLFGYSTDGLVNEDGLIEIKSPIDSAKIMMILETGDIAEYLHQIHGGLWITGRKWCDFIMFVPELAQVGKDLYVKRVYRDEAFIDEMVGHLHRFQDMAAAYEEILRRKAA